MALETLKNVTSIAGTVLTEQCDRDIHSRTKWPNEYSHIAVDHSANTITFKIQNGPIKEVGKNGVQLTAMIEVAAHMIAELSVKYPCEENRLTLDCLSQAMKYQNERTANRETRGVEGTSKI